MKITEVDLATGIRIAECTGCNGNVFLIEFKTVCEMKVSKRGFVTIVNPRLPIDLVSMQLKPENLTCAWCHFEHERKKKK